MGYLLMGLKEEDAPLSASFLLPEKGGRSRPGGITIRNVPQSGMCNVGQFRGRAAFNVLPIRPCRALAIMAIAA